MNIPLRAALVTIVVLASAVPCARTDDPRAAEATGGGTHDIPRNALGYRLAVPPWRFEFPRDHASHPDFQTEWWYYTGNVAAGNRRFGFELTFFRIGLDRERLASPSAWAPHTVLLAHLALTDVSGRRFRYEERIARPALGEAGADSTREQVWIQDWSAALESDGRTHRLIASGDTIAIDLTLRADRPPVIHGENGVSRKSTGLGEATHYYSIPRLATNGSVSISGHSFRVHGETWMDHEFGSARLAAHLVGWDWFGLQLDDGRALMLYVLRRKDGGVEPVSSGTLVEADGRARALPLGSFTVRPHRTWTSPHTGAVYPAGWTVDVPSASITLEIEPMLADQELVTRSAAGIVYWEGAVRIAGRSAGRGVTGRGYVELTGYTGRPPG